MRSISKQQERKLSGKDVVRIWKKYKETGDVRYRNQLVVAFTPLVKYIVYKKVRELPARCDVDDFVSCGIEALIGAIERYDSAQGASLEQYAWTRIHGAVLDELRRQDWAPRSLRRWERAIDRARDEYTVENGRHPTQSELADLLGIEEERLLNYETSIASSDFVSLNATVAADDDSTVERIDTVASSDATSDPESAILKTQAKERFRAAFVNLSERQRQVAVLLYAKNMTLRDIGAILGVSESRVCQIHAELKTVLRRELADDEALFTAIS